MKRTATIEVTSILGRTIPLTLDLEVSTCAAPPRATVVKIKPSVPLKKNEGIMELIIPSKVEADNGLYYVITEVGPNIFGQISAKNRSYIGSSLHPIIERIVIDDDITDIKTGAFYGICADTLVWPKSCRIIEEETFKNAYIKNYKGMENVFEIGQSAFRGNWGLKSFTWPQNCSVIPEFCFGSSGLKEITGIENVTSIKYSAFSYCNLMEDFTWPVNCEEIPEDCFFEANKLKNVNISGPISKINPSAFFATQVRELDLSDSLFVSGLDDFELENEDDITIKKSFYAL